MARNPIYPNTARETAVDRFLNDTLPRLIQNRRMLQSEEKDREFRDNQFDEQVRQFEVTETRLADDKLVKVRTDWESESSNVIALANDQMQLGNSEDASSMIENYIKRGEAIGVGRAAFANIRIIQKNFKEQGPRVDSYMKDVQIVDSNAPVEQKMAAFERLKVLNLTMDTYWQNDFNDKQINWKSDPNLDWLQTPETDVQVQQNVQEAIGLYQGTTGFEVFSDDIRKQYASVDEMPEFVKNKKTGLWEMKMTQGEPVMKSPNQLSEESKEQFYLYLYESRPDYYQKEKEAGQAFISLVEQEGLDEPDEIKAYLEGLSDFERERFIDAYVGSFADSLRENVILFDADGNEQPFGLAMSGDDLKKYMTSKGVDEKWLKDIDFGDYETQIKNAKASGIIDSKWHSTKEAASGDKKKKKQEKRVQTPDEFKSWFGGASDSYNYKGSVKRIDKAFDEYKKAVAKKTKNPNAFVSPENSPLSLKKIFELELGRHKEMFPDQPYQGRD